MPVFVKWNPVNHRFALDDTLDLFFDDRAETCRKRYLSPSTNWTPLTDVSETATAITVLMELAGIEQATLEIIFQDGVLLVRGCRPFSQAMQTAKIHRIERMYGAFQRALRIPAAVDPQQMSASYERGLLKILLPKLPADSSEPVKIPITFR